jgi:hypothetical protein
MGRRGAQGCVVVYAHFALHVKADNNLQRLKAAYIEAVTEESRLVPFLSKHLPHRKDR